MGVEAGGDHGDRYVRTPTRGPLDPHAHDTVRGQQLDRRHIAGGGVVKRRVGELDAVRVDDAYGEAVLVRSMPATGGAVMKVSCWVVGAVR